MNTPSAYVKRLASTARQQYDKFRFLRENEPPLSTQIAQYWTAGVGDKFPGVDIPWSAVFVSWCVKTAGATKQQFKFAAAHSQFVHQAIKNAGEAGAVFVGRALVDYVPKIGDILQNNRGGNRFDFTHASKHSSYSSHSAIVVEVGIDNKGRYLHTIGGNEGDTVALKEVRLDNQGRVKNPLGLYISAIETRL